MGSQWRRREKEANKETRGQRQDERGRMRGRKERSRTEGGTKRAARMRDHTTELRQMRQKRRGGGGEELSVGSTSTDLFPQDVFSSVAKDGCRTCSPVFRIKTRTPALCCRGSAEEHEEDHAFLQIGFAVEQSARARPCTALPLV